MAEIEEPEKPEKGAGWLGTFADLSLLMLVFFILLFSMSTIEAEKAKAVFGSMRDAFGGLGDQTASTGSSLQTESMDAAAIFMEQARVTQELFDAQRMAFNEIRSYLTVNGMDGKIGAVLDEGNITLSIGSMDLFREGRAELTREAEKTLVPILEIVKNEREMVLNIKGFTDSSPLPASSPYDNIWELSAMRSVNILQWFLEQGIPPVRLRATGMGDINPIYPADTPANRAKNNRVEFDLEKAM